jgi:hypothetical protein
MEVECASVPLRRSPRRTTRRPRRIRGRTSTGACARTARRTVTPDGVTRCGRRRRSPVAWSTAWSTGAVRERVACYVVRDLGDRLELLVFDHVGFPDAGTQVPPAAWTRESVSEAARGRCRGCGLSTVAVVGRLGTSDRPHARPAGRSAPTCSPTTRRATRLDVARRRNSEDEGLLFRCWFTPLPLDGRCPGQDEFSAPRRRR